MVSTYIKLAELTEVRGQISGREWPRFSGRPTQNGLSTATASSTGRVSSFSVHVQVFYTGLFYYKQKYAQQTPHKH